MFQFMKRLLNRVLFIKMNPKTFSWLGNYKFVTVVLFISVLSILSVNTNRSVHGKALENAFEHFVDSSCRIDSTLIINNDFMNFLLDHDLVYVYKNKTYAYGRTIMMFRKNNVNSVCYSLEKKCDKTALIDCESIIFDIAN